MKSKWKTVELSEVADLTVGFVGTMASHYTEDGVLFLRSTNIEPFDIKMDDVKFISRDFHEKIKKSQLNENDVVIVRTGKPGACTVIPKKAEPWNCSDLVIIRPNQNELDPVFLASYINLASGVINAHLVGAVQQHFNVGAAKKMKIPLPSISEQKRIASIVRALNDKIKTNCEINDNLYEMVNAYYTYLFKDVECEMTTIGSYAKCVYSGGTPTTSNAAYWNGSFGWFSSGETRNRFVISTEKTITQAGVDNSSTKLAKKHDIVMASAGQGFTRGQSSMLLLDTYVNQSVIVIHAERNVLPYLFWNLANRYEELRAISDSSSIRGSLTTKMISAFEIPHADEGSLQVFADYAWSVIPRIENNLLENERLAAIRDSLLPKLMSGEIDVSDIQR